MKKIWDLLDDFEKALCSFFMKSRANCGQGYLGLENPVLDFLPF